MEITSARLLLIKSINRSEDGENLSEDQYFHTNSLRVTNPTNCKRLRVKSDVAVVVYSSRRSGLSS